MINNAIKSIIFLFIFELALSFGAQPLDGSEKSFQSAFESLLKSDGNNAEEWDVEIGKMIKTHPTRFLKVLKTYKSKVKRIDALVGNFGDGFVDDFEKTKEEARLRIKALESAKKRTGDTQIKELADECIKILRNY